MHASLLSSRQKHRSISNPGGFTLIELLIVVAIIAILAAIAVPNFLEAQVRSKVSRVKSDLRTIVTGLEAYAVDFNAYPPSNNFLDPLPSARLRPLTTPVAYLTSIPLDAFQRRNSGTFEQLLLSIDPNEPLDSYIYNLGSNAAALGGEGTVVSRRQYSMTSAGPDGLLEFPYYAFSPTFVGGGVYLQYIYDPTNGTVSRGEIFRRGGVIPDSIPGFPNQ
jgi:type II secretion system protein G